MRIALTTCRKWPNLSASDALLRDELAGRGHEVHPDPWNDAAIDTFVGADAVVLRSNWDYHHDVARFAGWLDGLERAGACVINPLPLVRWSLTKTYLADLRRSGLPVPELCVFSGGDATEVLEWTAGRERVVIKPLIGASGHDVRLVGEADVAATVAALADDDRRYLAQRFVTDVGGGEWALVFFGGRFHHAYQRVPAPGEFRVNSQYGGSLRPGVPPPELVSLGEDAVAELPADPVYARIDVIETSDGPALMEVELNEPALGLHLHPNAPIRFADVVVDAIAS